MCIQLSESAHQALVESGGGFEMTQRGQIEIKVGPTIVRLEYLLLGMISQKPIFGNTFQYIYHERV